MTMPHFYTHIFHDREGIRYRGYKDGYRIKAILPYKPSLFVPSNEPTGYKTIYGNDVKRMEFENIEMAQEFVRSVQDLGHEYLYGNTRYHYAFLADTFKEQIDFDINLIKKVTIDIEVDTSKGYAPTVNPYAPIITITLKSFNTFYVFGLKPYTPKRPDVKYKQFPNEMAMLQAFVTAWKKLDFDILFGWNTDQYDIPYIVNRINRVLGSGAANSLSPWNKIREHFINFKGQQIQTYDILGISSLDYIDLYRRYMPKAESDALKSVGELELGETKVDYEGTLHELYANDYDKFIEYNIQDVALVDKLDAKLKLADMVITTAYDAKCNFADVQQQVRMWDAIAFNELKKKKIAVPQIKIASKTEKFTGAFVLPAQAGIHKWVVSFDFASLYPSLMIEHNISPDSIEHQTLNVFKNDLNDKKLNFDEEGMVSRREDLSFLSDLNYCCSGAGWLFRRDKQGAFGEILEQMFIDRMKYKELMKEADIARSKTTDVQEKKKLDYAYAKYKNFQLAKKIQLNAAYGATGSPYFRFFDLRLARSVTLSGRSILLQVKEHITKKIHQRFNIDYDPIIYGDTDSLYITAKPFVDQLEDNLTPQDIVEKIDKIYCDEILTYINEAIVMHRSRYNTLKPQIEMVRDVIAERTIFVSKKRYVMEIWDKEGKRYKSPDRKATGLEMIKSTTAAFCKAWLNQAIDFILDNDVNGLSRFIDTNRLAFRKLPIDLISYPQNVNDIEKYISQFDSNKVINFDNTLDRDMNDENESGLKKGTPIGAAAAFTFNRALDERGLKYEKIKSGVRMRYIYLKCDNPFKSHVIGMLDKPPRELELDKWIDYEAQFKKVFINPVNILLKAVGWRPIGEAPSVMGIFD